MIKHISISVNFPTKAGIEFLYVQNKINQWEYEFLKSIATKNSLTNPQKMTAINILTRKGVDCCYEYYKEEFRFLKDHFED